MLVMGGWCGKHICFKRTWLVFVNIRLFIINVNATCSGDDENVFCDPGHVREREVLDLVYKSSL